MSIGTVIATLGEILAVINTVTEIIAACDDLYKDADTFLNNILDTSEGSFVDDLKEIGGKLKVRYEELIGGMRKMLEAIQAAHDELKKADTQSAAAIKAANANL